MKTGGGVKRRGKGGGVEREQWGLRGAGRQDVTPEQPPAPLQGGGADDAFYPSQCFQSWAWDGPAGTVGKSPPYRGLGFDPRGQARSLIPTARDGSNSEMMPLGPCQYPPWACVLSF